MLDDIKTLEMRMRKKEWFHTLRIPEDLWFVVRLDGRGFTNFTKNMEKPFDCKFHESMVGVTQALMKEFNCVFGETHSDEISLLFPYNCDLFDREQEKLVSLTASCASALFTSTLVRLGLFDSRIWLGTDIQDVADYFYWRQTDAMRGGLNSWAYWLLRFKDGLSPKNATTVLHEKDSAFKQELLFSKFGVNFNDLPIWQKRGTVFYWEHYEKIGYDPTQEKQVVATRRRLVTQEKPLKTRQYHEFLSGNLIHATTENQWTFDKTRVQKYYDESNA